MLIKFSKAFLVLLGVTFSIATFSSELVLFSPVKGLVQLEGKPVEGAKVVHSYRWKDESFTEDITTDASGQFAFSAKKHRSFFWSFFPHNPAIGQEISISYKGKTYTAWRFTKGDYEHNSENQDAPLLMRCDLAKSEKVHALSELTDYFGICEIG